MSGERVLRIPAVRKPPRGDATMARPWFAPPRLGDRPAILTFVGTEKSFVEALFEGVTRSGEGYDAGAFPAILAMRDFAEPPRALLDGDGSPGYARAHVELTAAERPVVGELAPDPDAAAASTLSALLPPGALPPLSDASRPGWLRKLYLPMHQHFHVVCCQLDCKRPGTPRIDPKRVLEAGLVVRRYIPDATAEEARWEDWIPSPHGDGIWAEIADERMTTLRGSKRAVDPARLFDDVFGADHAAILERLGVAKDPKIALGLAPAKLAAFPVGLGASRKRTARWGFLPIASSEKEREQSEVPATAGAIADYFADVAGAHLGDRLLAPAAAIRDRIRAAVQPLLVGFRDTLPPAPTAAEVNAAASLVASKPGVNAAEIDAAAAIIGMSALSWYGRGIDIPAPANRWAAAITLFAAVFDPPVPGSPPVIVPPALPGWVSSIIATSEPELGVLALAKVHAAFALLLPPAGFADDVDARILAAVLLWIRAHRGQLLRAFYQKVFVEDLALPLPDVDAFVVAPDPSRPPPRAPTTVGAMGEEIEGWIAADADRDRSPVPWGSPSLSTASLGVHRLATALEVALADVDAQGAGAGGAYAEVVDGLASAAYGHLASAVGGPSPVYRGLSWKLRAQPERGLLAFPGPSPSAASLSAFTDSVKARYATDAAARPDLVLAMGKARRQVIRARYDADHLYACFCYAKVAGRDDCEPIEIVWSARTDVFSLAEPMDILGLKPVSIQLPDLPKLMRDVPRMRKARALPFAAVVTPQGSGFLTGDDPKDTSREWGIAWVCSFAIPIFTITAWIIFKLMFSILIVIPSFAWMLLLKICIPVPSPKKS